MLCTALLPLKIGEMLLSVGDHSLLGEQRGELHAVSLRQEHG